jgi:hypothetical protein
MKESTLRYRHSGAGIKPLQAAAVKSSGRERWRKSENKSGEVWTRKTNETEPLLSHRKTFSDIKTMAICGAMG